MFYDEDKKIATVVRARRDKSGSRVSDPVKVKPEISKTEDGEPDGKHAAMQDFMSAHQEGSAQKMSDALSNFLDIHQSRDAGDESGEEPV